MSSNRMRYDVPFLPRLGPLRLLPLLLIIMAAWGVLLSRLPVHSFTMVLSGGLFLANGLALALLIRRSREPGPEQRGWKLFAASVAVIIGSNLFLFFTRPLFVGLPLAEVGYLGLQIAAGVLQAWALLVWPFHSSAQEYRHPLNVMGSLLFILAIFLLFWGTVLCKVPRQDQVATYLRMMVLAIRVALVVGISVYFLAENPGRMKGPLGWFLFGSLVWACTILLVNSLLRNANAELQPSPLFTLTLAAPFSLILMASARTPVEPLGTGGRIAFEFIEFLIVLPFLAVGILLVVFVTLDRGQLLAVLLGFLALCLLFLIRHFFLLKEAYMANEILEDRVLARTRDLEKMQVTLLRTERMNSVATLGAGLAHDLNNALGIVKARAELNQMKLDQGEALNDSDMERILIAADQSAALTRRLMAFARMEEEPPILIDLHRETADLEPLLRMLLPRNIALKLTFRDPVTPVLGSRDRIEQMLVNLVGNARDAMPDGGHIAVELDREGESPESRVFLRVIDDGPGIPPELLERIFQPFFTTKPSGKGTGLGLPSVRHAMEELGGSLEVQSEPGRGSTFTLWFPPPSVMGTGGSD